MSHTKLAVIFMVVEVCILCELRVFPEVAVVRCVCRVESGEIEQGLIGELKWE